MLRASALAAMVVVAGLAAASCNLLTKSCTLVGCDDGPHVVVTVHRPIDEITESSITTCFNDACTTRKPRDTLVDDARPAFYRPRALRYEGGNLSDRGEGWTVISLFVPSGPYADGDRYRVAITNAKGERVLDVERRFLYTIVQPNGSDCTPTCSAASARLFEQTQSGLSCPGATCLTDVLVRTRIASIESQDAILTVCRNSVCSTADKGLTDPALVLQGELAARFAAISMKGGIELSMRMLAESPMLADGDVYSVRIVVPRTGAVLKASEKRVTYDAVFPNNAACDVFPCRRAVVELD